MKLLVKKIDEIMTQYNDFLDFIGPDDLNKQLVLASSNTIAQHLRCVIAGRISMLDSFPTNKNFEWHVSIKDDELNDFKKMQFHLSKSGKDLMSMLTSNDLNEQQKEILLDMINHEYMHQGQLVRYLIHHGMGYPQSWDKKWYFSYD